MRDLVAIVGGEALTPLGSDLAATLAALARGECAVAAWPDARAWGERPPWVARLPDAREGLEDDPTLRMLGRHGEWLDQVGRAAHGAARLDELPREEVGLFAALGMVDSPPEELAPAVLAARAPDGRFDLERFFDGGYRAIHPLWPLSMLGNVAVGQLAIGLDLRGDNTVLASDEDAGLRALASALESIETGAARAILVVAASEPVHELSLLRADLRGLLARGPQAPASGAGVLGEGAASLVLERESSARARGVRVLGRILGHAAATRSSAGGEGEFATVVERALARAARTPRDVALVLTDRVLGTRADALPSETLPSETLPSEALPSEALPADLAALLPDVARGPAEARASRASRASRALGRLGPAAALLDVLVALDALPALPSRAGAEHPPCALVLATSGDGAVGVLVVEASACAS